MKHSPFTLSTSRLILRPVDLVDLNAMAEIFHDKEDCDLMCCDPLMNLSLVKDRLDSLRKFNDIGFGQHWTLVKSDHGLPIGFCSSFLPAPQLVPNKFCEISYCLVKSHRKQGLMKEALTSCLEHLVSGMKFNRIEATVNPKNHASQRLLQNLGFSYEGVLRERLLWDGQFQDIKAYSLLSREFSSSL